MIELCVLVDEIDIFRFHFKDININLTIHIHELYSEFFYHIFRSYDSTDTIRNICTSNFKK